MDTAIIGSSKNAMAATEPANTGHFFIKQPAKAPSKNGNKPLATAPTMIIGIRARDLPKDSVRTVRKTIPSPIKYHFSLTFLIINCPLFLAIASATLVLIQFACGPPDSADDQRAIILVCVTGRTVTQLDAADVGLAALSDPAYRLVTVRMVGGQ